MRAVGVVFLINNINHPFWIPQKGWTEAIDLKAGDRLQLVNGNIVTLEQIQHEIAESTVLVYNLEVEDWHTYYVGTNGVLVHNGVCIPDLENLPEGWSRTDNNGFTHIRDADGNIRVRIDPPDANTPYKAYLFVQVSIVRVLIRFIFTVEKSI